MLGDLFTAAIILELVSPGTITGIIGRFLPAKPGDPQQPPPVGFGGALPPRAIPAGGVEPWPTLFDGKSYSSARIPTVVGVGAMDPKGVQWVTRRAIPDGGWEGIYWTRGAAQGARARIADHTRGMVTYGWVEGVST